MLRYFRRLRRRLIVGSHFRKYVLYAIGEIVLVVIGILIALWVNNWNTARYERQEEQNTYRNIRREVQEDREDLYRVKGFNEYYLGRYAVANGIILAQDRSQVDTLALISMGLSQFSDFRRSGNIYETLLNSGELRRLRRQDITSNLQGLEMTYHYLNKLEDMHWELIVGEVSPAMRGVINYATQETVLPDQLYSVEMQNIFVEMLFLTAGKDSIYQRALNEISTVVGLIDAELGLPEH